VAERADKPIVEVGTQPATPTITLDGIDVARQIRSDGVTAAVSAVSAVPRVREVLRHQQRSIIGGGGIVVEGRDIGTVVAPTAQLKVYLNADPAARARRRSAEMAAPGDEQSVQDALLRRDTSDSTRAVSPLSCAADAVVLDTTSLPLSDVVTMLVELTLERASASRVS
jgi:cytidylate kinase